VQAHTQKHEFIQLGKIGLHASRKKVHKACIQERCMHLGQVHKVGAGAAPS